MAHDGTTGRFRLGDEDVVIPSDALADLWPILNRLRELVPEFTGVLQLAFVLDACVVQRELRWRLAQRHEPSARSALHELIASGVVVAFAPPWLDQEIRDHSDKIADDCRVQVARVLDEWDEFRHLIRFYQPAAVERAMGPDAEDLPYLATWSELAAAGIVTTDHHFRQTRAPIIALGVFPELRTYARAAAVRVTISVATTAVGAAAIGAAVLAAKAFLSLPGIAQVALAVASLIAIAHPKSRRAIADGLRKAGVVLDIMGQAAEAWAQASAAEKAALANIRRALPARPKATALAYARGVCALSDRPLALAEIERRMRLEGYRSRARSAGPYLRRLVRGSGQFAEVSPGRWALRPAPAN